MDDRVKPVGVGVAAVIVILLVAALLFGGLRFQTTQVNNTSNTYVSSEGVFHQWTQVWNISVAGGALPLFISDVAVVISFSSNITWYSVATGGVITFCYACLSSSGSFDPTWTINGVYGLWSNSTHVMQIRGHDGTLLQAFRYAGGVQDECISSNGLYALAIVIGSPNWRAVLYSGS